MRKLSTAIRIAAVAFEGETDRGGNPYILHCLHVMNQMPSDDPELMTIAVLHDVVEDTRWTMSDLEQKGFSNRVLTAVDTLTHRLEESYDQYIKTISNNPDAVKVKLADLAHNSDITRIKGLRKKDFDRIEKYHRAFVYLSS